MAKNIALRPLKQARTFQYGTWDIEAREWWDLILIGVYDGEQYYHFRDVGSFLDHIMQEKYRYWRWFAHFGGRYDMNFIFEYIRYQRPELFPSVSWFCSGAMVLDMTIRWKRGVAKLRDSYRLLPGSLRALTKAFGVEHQKGEIDFEGIEYNRTLIEYNELDCIGLHEVLAIFFEQTGVFSETFATNALKVFRKDFLKFDLWKPHKAVEEFVRRSYHGGRVEVFKRTGEEVYAYDVNSMYPFVMLQPVPIRFYAESRKLHDKRYGFCEATIRWPGVYVPNLPLRYASNGKPLDKLYFPVGEYRGIWTTPELIEAEKKGCTIIKIHKILYFDTEKIFEGYVRKIYALKQRSGEPQRTIAKFLLNSLYGKFGQHPTKKAYCTLDDAPEGAIPILTPDGKPTPFAYFERESEAAYILPHISASITSAARLQLLSQLNESSYYCDTDSVFTSRQMPTGDALGEWGLVGQGNCEFYQPKLYKFRGEWKAKGLNRFQNIDGYVRGEPNIVKRSRSITEAVKSGLPATAHVTVKKYLREGKPKRAWDGENDTRPWKYDELITS
jgi:hypothetical protein